MFGIAKEAHEFHGNVAVKLEFYLDKADCGYEQTYVSMPDFTGATYKGKLDKDGNPRDPLDYQAWVDSLPKKWQLNPFHNHFIYLPPDYTSKDVEREIWYHQPNFYAAWAAGKTMRSGWDTATRIRPVRFDKVHPADYEVKKQACLSKIATIQPVSLLVDGIGMTYPATTIDVGAGATERAWYSGLANSETFVEKTNPANETGIIDTFEIWAAADAGNLANCKMGVASGSSTSYSANDYATLGTVTAGSKQTFTGLDVDVESGNFIAAYYEDGNVSYDASGGGGTYYKYGDWFGSGTQTFFGAGSPLMSLYGTGETASVGARLLSLTGVGT